MGFYHGNVLEIKDDLLALRPTIFVSVPRLWNKMVDGIKAKLGELRGMKKWLADKAVKTKLKKCLETGEYKHCLWDKIIFKKIRAATGGWVRRMISGSAPLSKDTIAFLKICFSCSF